MGSLQMKDSNREAFENFFYENCLVQWEKDMHEMLFQKLESGDYEYVRLQSSWLSWQAAKAQAVPEGFVLAPEECSDDMACKIADIARVCGGIAGDIYEAVVNQAMIEAQEQNQ